MYETIFLIAVIFGVLFLLWFSSMMILVVIKLTDWIGKKLKWW